MRHKHELGQTSNSQSTKGREEESFTFVHIGSFRIDLMSLVTTHTKTQTKFLQSFYANFITELLSMKDNGKANNLWSKYHALKQGYVKLFYIYLHRKLLLCRRPPTAVQSVPSFFGRFVVKKLCINCIVSSHMHQQWILRQSRASWRMALTVLLSPLSFDRELSSINFILKSRPERHQMCT